VTLEAAVNVPVSVLKIEECSTSTEDRASEAERFLGKLLISEPAMDKEPVKVLNMEACSVMVEDEPRKPVKNST